MIVGGIEAGGTKWVCATGSGPDDLHETVTFPTTTPEETLARAAAFFSDNGSVAAVGIGSFGPVDVRPGSGTWGHITTTPKAGWGDTDLVAGLRLPAGIPVAVDTDVNAAALGEQRWGAAAGCDTFSYITVGTGIGGGGMVSGRLMHGLLHPELGHIRIPHDRARDPFDGVCPYHGNCFEGLASGHSMTVRWGKPGVEIEDDEAWQLEAEYLALGLVNLICTLSPQRIVMGGGVMKQPGLFPLVRTRVRELLAGYVAAPELEDGLDEYIVPPALGDRSGVLGAIALAQAAVP
jgi:fructokinase